MESGFLPTKSNYLDAFMMNTDKITRKYGPTTHRKELQGTENSAKNYKELQDTFKRSTK